MVSSVSIRSAIRGKTVSKTYPPQPEGIGGAFISSLDLQHRCEPGDYLQPRIARALLQLAQISAVDGHGCSEVDGLGSFWLAGRQAQARQEEFAVLRITPVKGIGHYQRCDSS